MSSPTTQAAPTPARGAVSRDYGSHRRGAFALTEVRWAAAATLLFVAGVVCHLFDQPDWLVWGLYLACYATGGWEPGWAGLQALREKTLDVDLLMVVAAILAASIGQVFDGALLIVIFATSGALEALATQRTEDSIRSLLDLAPERATRLLPDGTSESVETTELKIGDIVLVRPGERIGADGTVFDGASDVDQSSITGEPIPVDKKVEDEVFAGTLNGAGALRIRVTREAAETVVARIVAMVQEASETKAKTQLFVEKIEQRYSIGMVVATLAVFFIPLAFGEDLEATLLRAITFMIVASPCAVVLSTMPPLLSAMANAGRHGVLIKSAIALEEIGQTTVVAFDKTGTLTEGVPRVVDVRAMPDIDETRLLALAAAAEFPSEHPLGRAVVSAATERELEIPEVQDFSSSPGTGVQAVVDGHVVQVGSPKQLIGNDVDEARQTLVDEACGNLETQGRTVVVVTLDGIPAGVLGLADRLRGTAGETVHTLNRITGNPPVLLTGDNARAARKLAGEVGIEDVRAGLLPQDKVVAVRELQESGHSVLAVGDGVNDAPALAAARSGIAMGRAGSDLALETSDAVVVRDELATIPAAIALSRRARRLVVANLCIAGTFITALVAWDLLGHLPLPLGVAGHEGSTVIVGLNGLRLLRESAWRRALKEGADE